MSTQDGPKYPGPSDGLVFCFDAKNRKCWNGDDIVNNLPGLDSSISGSAHNLGPTEWGGASTKEGYVSFDGTDDLINLAPMAGTTGTIPQFQFDNEFTVSTWFRSNDIGASPQRVIGVAGIGNNIGWCLYTAYKAKFEVYKNSTTQCNSVWHNSGPGYNDFLNDPIPPPLGSAVWNSGWNSNPIWYNIVGVKGDNGDSNNVTCYRNGVKGDQGSSVQGTAPDIDYTYSSYPTAANPNYVAIGSGWWRDSDGYRVNPFSGDIAIVMVWNRALSDGELKTHFNNLKDRFGI